MVVLLMSFGADPSIFDGEGEFAIFWILCIFFWLLLLCLLVLEGLIS